MPLQDLWNVVNPHPTKDDARALAEIGSSLVFWLHLLARLAIFFVQLKEKGGISVDSVLLGISGIGH